MISGTCQAGFSRVRPDFSVNQAILIGLCRVCNPDNSLHAAKIVAGEGADVLVLARLARRRKRDRDRFAGIGKGRVGQNGVIVGILPAGPRPSDAKVR